MKRLLSAVLALALLLTPALCAPAAAADALPADVEVFYRQLSPAAREVFDLLNTEEGFAHIRAGEPIEMRVEGTYGSEAELRRQINARFAAAAEAYAALLQCHPEIFWTKSCKVSGNCSYGGGSYTLPVVIAPQFENAWRDGGRDVSADEDTLRAAVQALGGEQAAEQYWDLAAIGTVGTHAALLPHNRGSAPVNWAIIRGEEETGNTLMWLSKEVDSGEIIDQTAFPITLFDTCKTIYDKVAASNAVMLDKLIDALIKGEKPVSSISNETDEELLPRRRPKDGLMDWQQDAKKIYDFIRALTLPYPGAFTFLDGRKWLIWEAMVLPVKSTELPGTILGNAYGFKDCGILAATKDYTICITMVEDEEGKRYSGSTLYELELKGVFGNE